MNPVIAITAGGTGGHVFPGLAAAAALREAGASVVWIGTEHGLENRVVPEYGIELRRLPMRAVRGGGIRRKLLAPLRLSMALINARRVLADVRPALVLGMGGYAAAPTGIVAWLMRIPLIIHEQNARAGLTNRLLARFAKRILQAFPGTFEGRDSVLTCGNPVREEIVNLPEPAQRGHWAQAPFRLLVLGGSQGAKVLNETLPKVLGKLEAGDIQVRHQCGSAHLQAAQNAYEDAGVDAQVETFIEDMAQAYAWAHLVVCRAGALTVSELCAAGVPAVLVPLPHAADDHQRLNAEYMSQAGAGWLEPESKDFESALAQRLGKLLANPSALLQAAQAARSLARTDADQIVANQCLELAHG